MPTLAPLVTAPLAVQIHVAAALLAILLLPFTLFRTRRDRIHKRAGYIWVAALGTAAFSSFFIRGMETVGPFSPIHLISVYTLIGLWQALRFAVKRDIAAHQAAMKGMAVGALGLAGLLSFLPGRRMNQALFGDHGEEGFMIALAVAVCLAGWHFLSGRSAKSG